MIRFIHSADWQLGARFSQFGAKGNVLRAARLTTLRRVLELARNEAVDAFLVAGDLFEDNQVEDRLVESVAKLFGEFDSVPIYLLPGNHDPDSGLDSVWRRKAFSHPPANVQVLRETAATPLRNDAVLLASPLRQKLSSTDPSLALDALAAGVPQDTIRIGITHGALAIEGMHQPNDFPIALDAASRAGIDYLALGHWHNWLAETDGGRMVQPGTPEPEQFASARSGHVALVEIGKRGAMPKVEAVRVATLQWRELVFDFVQPDASRAEVGAAFRDLLPKIGETVLRVTLRGGASPTELAEVRAWLDEAVSDFPIAQIVDRTTLELGEAERSELLARHPILGQVLADVDRLESLATGSGAIPDSAPVAEAGVSSLTLAEAQEILSRSKIDLAALSPEFFGTLRRVLFRNLQEAGG